MKPLPIHAVNNDGQKYCDKLLMALDAPVRKRIQAREPYLTAVKACQAALAEGDVEELKQSYRDRWAQINALALTDTRDTIQERMHRHYADVSEALFAAEPEKAAQVYGHPDHASYQDAITDARNAQDVQALEAALEARRVFVWQIIEGKYAVQDLAGGGRDAIFS